MNSKVVLVALALGAGALAIPTARAQPASAIGQPLAKANLPNGTLTVRILAGDMSSPVAGVDVRLTVDGKLRPARTDASGLATFRDLPPGTTVQAAADGAAGEVTSVEFAMPGQGGMAVFLSTVPWKAGAGGPMGGAGRPEPRKMAGQPRPEPDDPVGRVTVRLTYNDVDARRDPFGDRPVTMVAYAADGRIAARTLRTDVDGRAVFDNLDTTGGTAYYALASLPRGDHHDRLQSLPILPGAEMGMRVLLSGEKLTGNAPPVDDLSRFTRQPAIAPGHLVVVFGGAIPEEGTVELLDATSGKVVTTAEIGHARPLPSSIEATLGEPVPDPKVAAGTAQVTVEVAAGKQTIGLPQAAIRIRAIAPPVDPARPPAEPLAPPPPAPPPFDHLEVTDADGHATLAGAPIGVPLELVADIFGKSFTSAPFQLGADQGAAIKVSTRFDVLSTFQADFTTVAPSPEGAYLAQLKLGGETYRSMPFQMLPDRGVVIPIHVGDRISMSFEELNAFVDDEYLAVRGDFVIENTSWAPWAGPREGVRIPAPRGAGGLVIADEDKSWVAVDSGSFRMLRPVPPIGGGFRGAFSIKSDDGSVSWDWPLPLGVADASLAIRLVPRMEVKLPPGTQHRTVKEGGFSWKAIGNIDIAPGQRMVFQVDGMPRRPGWQWAARVITGVAVILLIGLGVFFAVWRGSLAQLSSSPVTILILTVLTFGLFGIIWLIGARRALNARHDARIPTAWLWLIPLGGIYWLWKFAEGAEKPAKAPAMMSFLLLWLLFPIGVFVMAQRLGAELAAAPAEAAPAPGPTRKQRRRRIEQLLDEVALIDRDREDGDPARRDALVTELETLYRDDA